MSNDTPPIYIVSGGTGASGEQIVHTVLAQFPDHQPQVIAVPAVRHAEQVAHVIERAAADGGTIVHTMVDAVLRSELTKRTAERGVVAVDLMGPLQDRLVAVFGQEPLNQPGLYRQLNQAYFERVSAIDFCMAHDDGRSPEDWPEAEIVLVGVSRVGKTPLTMYLGVLGWKVANVPLIPSLDPPTGLFDLDRRRVIGLTIDPLRLMTHRQQRLRRLGAPGLEAYTDLSAIYDEVETARRTCRRGGFTVIDITDSPIEASANHVLDLITGRFGKYRT